jgi:hypothetical protein
LELMITADVEDDGDDVLAGWLFPELALVLEDEDPHAATAATAPTARLPYSSLAADARPERMMAMFTETPFSGSIAALLSRSYGKSVLRDWSHRGDGIPCPPAAAVRGPRMAVCPAPRLGVRCPQLHSSP